MASEVLKREVKIHWISLCKLAWWLSAAIMNRKGDRVKPCLDALTKRLHAGFYIQVALCILNCLQVMVLLKVLDEISGLWRTLCLFKAKSISRVHRLLPHALYHPSFTFQSYIGFFSEAWSGRENNCFYQRLWSIAYIRFSYLLVWSANALLQACIYCVLLTVFHKS